ncbi:MAG: hypothetical protein GY925_07460 [Actinomycetia bacterium]|nr:hypothetical protein [Actinomycetes bacterium]
MNNAVGMSNAVVVYEIFGCAVRFEAPQPHLDAIAEGLAFANPVTTSARPAVTYTAITDGDGLRYERRDPGRPPDPARVGKTTARVLDDLHLSVALHSRAGVFVHAGVVGWNDRAILLPGRSRWGKSTLVEALVRAGAQYLSDEYAILLPNGRIQSYPRPIHLRTPHGPMLLDPRSIGTVAPRSYPPSIVVLTRYESGANWNPEVLTPASAALAVFDSMVVAAVIPERAMGSAATLVRQIVAVHSLRDEAASTVPAILELAERTAERKYR